MGDGAGSTVVYDRRVIPQPDDRELQQPRPRPAKAEAEDRPCDEEDRSAHREQPQPGRPEEETPCHHGYVPSRTAVGEPWPEDLPAEDLIRLEREGHTELARLTR